MSNSTYCEDEWWPDEEESSKEEPVSEDLEAEIDNIREKYRGLESLCEHDIIEICEHFFKFGAEWHKQQMMKSAVEAEVGEYYPTTIHLDKDIPELKHFDKVKLIIIMEE